MTSFDLVKRQCQHMLRKLHAAAVENRVRRTLRNPAPASTDTVDFVVFFADEPGQSYQLEQWTAPFEALQNRGYGVCLVVMNALSAKVLNDSSNLPILLMRSMEKIETCLDSWGTRGIFYVNNSRANFTMLRVNGPAHIHLSHGESEKSSMVSNQLKAYDFAFIAGEAARNRILAHVPRFDPAKLVEIGRPQLNLQALKTGATRTSSRIKILYAPTWEGDGKSMAYSSVTAIGAELIETLLRDDRFSIVFRPHPKLGTWSAKTRQELTHIQKAIEMAQGRTPEAGHSVDTSGDSSLSIMNADIVLCDISAIAMDTIGLDKPLMLLCSVDTALSEELASNQVMSFQQAREQLAEGNGQELLNNLAAMGTALPSSEQRNLRNKVFGDPSLGTATERFIAAAVAATSTAAGK